MYRISSGVRSTHVQDGAVVLDVEQGRMFNLNLVGSKILELLEQGSTESDIVTAISCEFHASTAEIANDIRDFIDSLKKNGLIDDHLENEPREAGAENWPL